jgi:tRNA (guanine26-N2/guanine27-N2)-dimethyltransferase
MVFMEIEEGNARIEVLDGVFYNPKMKGLRDISVAYLNSVSKGKETLLDSTPATGIRGIRYALEAGIDDITFVEINNSAYENIIRNLNKNNMQNAVAYNKSIQEFANSYNGAFDFIDVDPFGSPAPYIHDLLKVSKDNTVIMITATDTAVLCGAHSNACIKTYSSMPMHNELCHEVGLRILACFIAREAAQFNFGIEVELAIANMHYMRIFVRLNRGANKAVESIKKCGFALYCNKCHNFSYKKGIATSIDDKCSYCNSKMQISGPMWLDSINNKQVVGKMLGMQLNIEEEKLLGTIYKEIDTPFFFAIPKLTKYMKRGAVSAADVVKVLSEEGYEVSKTHVDNNSIKTNAHIGEIIKVIEKLP